MHPFASVFIVTLIMSLFVHAFELTTFGWPGGGNVQFGNATRNVILGVIDLQVDNNGHVTAVPGNLLLSAIALAFALASTTLLAGIIAGVNPVALGSLAAVGGLMGAFFGSAFAPVVILNSIPGVPLALVMILGVGMGMVYIVGLTLFIRGMS